MRWVALSLLAACSGAQGDGGAGDPRAADRDGDGWSPGEGDCDDRDPGVFPEAVDWPGDGVDSDCDGHDDRPLKAVGLQPGDLVINEIHADPLVVAQQAGEWFEVVNTSGVAVDLEGLLVGDADGGETIEISVPLEVPADGWVVLGAVAHPEVVSPDNGDAPVDWGWQGEIRLSNVEDSLRLWLPGGLVVDEVRWDATFPSEQGHSLSLNPDLRDASANDDAAAWCLGQDSYGVGGFGTPGAANPACPGAPGRPLFEVATGALVITEIFHTAALGGDEPDWIEVTSLADAVVDLQGLTIQDDGNQTTLDTTLLIAPGQLLVFAASADVTVNGGVTPDWHWDEAFGLGDDDRASLRVGARILDEVVWGAEPFPHAEGRSLSLDPDHVDGFENDDGDRWCLGQTPFGAGDLGTPGSANPACP